MTLAQLRAHAGRLIATCLAIVIAVGFVVATLVLNDTTEATIRGGVAAQYVSADAVVVLDDSQLGISEGEPVDEAVVQRALRGVPELGAAAPEREVTGELVLPDGEGSRFAQIHGVANDPKLRWQEPVAGRLPERSGEVVLDRRADVPVGGTVNLVPEAGEDVGTVQLKVVGLLDLSDDPRAGGIAQVFTTDEQVAAWGGGVAEVRAVAAPGVSPEMLVERLSAAMTAAGVTGVTVETGTERAEAAVAQFTGDAAALATVLLVFAAIAVLVAGLVIANTFSVLVVQRTRELALLRCVGVIGRQVRRGVLVEAAVVGVLAAGAGVLAGIGLAAAVSSIAGRFDGPIPLDGVTVHVPPILWGLAVGVTVTVLAAYPPARRATRVSPLAALRPMDAPSIRSRAGLLRLGFGLLLFVPGVVVLGYAVAEAELLIGVAGGAASFLGVILLSRRAIPPVVSLAGRLVAARTGIPGELAAVNAVRNPERTAATATALLIGVTLTTAMVIGAASTRATATAALDGRYPTDVIVDTGGDGSEVLPLALVDQLGELPGVAVAVPVSTSLASIQGLETRILGVDPAAANRVLRSDAELEPPAAGVLNLPERLLPGVQEGARVEIKSGKRTRTLRVHLVDPELEPMTTVADLAGLSPGAPTTEAWLRLDDGLSDDRQAQIIRDVTRAAGAITPTAFVFGPAEERAALDRIVTGLLLFVTALLGVAVVIALIGVGNTIALSVIERRQEIGLTRALGLTRGQLRATLLWEAVLIAGVAAILGTVLGAGYGIAGTAAALGAEETVRVAIPWSQVVLIIAIATAAGALASVLPSRRAARTAPIAAIAIA